MKKKRKKDEVCGITEEIKSGYDYSQIGFLPQNYLYKIEGSSARDELGKVWKDPKAKKKLCQNLKKSKRVN